MRFFESDQFLPAQRSEARILLGAAEAVGDEDEGIGGETALGSLFSLRRSGDPLEAVETLGRELNFRVEWSIEWRPIAGEPPELAVLDGTARGAEARLRRWKAAALESETPILVLVSSRVRAQTLDRLHAAGATDFLSIEANALEARARLQTLIELGRARVEIVELRERLGRQIRVDELTGVMSRRFFFHQAHRECSRARRYGHPLACLMLEADHFKMIGSTFGSGAAEYVLRALAVVIGQWTRDSDLIARFSEAKFAILLPETEIDGATSVREKLLEALAAHPWHFNGEELPVSVSIGEARLPLPALRAPMGADEVISEGDEVDEIALSARESLAGLLEDADAALFVARKAVRVPEIFVPYTFAPRP